MGKPVDRPLSPGDQRVPPLLWHAAGLTLLRREALERLGGLTCIRHEWIDDRSLAREVKRGGHRIWLGLSGTSRSARGYGSVQEILKMTLLFVPMVRFYGQSPLWALLLPVTALLYLWATVLSAWRYHRGRGGGWKGRSQAAPRGGTRR